MYIYIYKYTCVPGSRFGSPPLLPNGMVPPLPAKKYPICVLFTAYLQQLRAVYFLQNSSVLIMYYLHAVYILRIYIYVFLFHLYATNTVSIYYSYAILLYIYILPIACLYAAYHGAPIYYHIQYYLSPTHTRLISCINPPSPHPPHLRGGVNHIHYLDTSY